VDSAKPDLLDVLARKWLAPHVVAEVAAALVDGDGVTAVGHVRIACGVGQLQRVPDPTDGTDGVPQADQMWRAGAAEGGFEAGGHCKRVDFAGGFAGALRVHAHNILGEAFVARAEQPEHVQHAGDRACGVGSAAEAEEIDVVALLVDVHQIAVGVGYVFEDACSECQTCDDGDRGFQLVGRGRGAFCAYSGMVVADLALAIDDEGAIEVDDVGCDRRYSSPVPSQQMTMFFAIRSPLILR